MQLALIAALAAAAVPQPAQDSVTGTASTGAARSFAEFTFDAHSGPSGENPTGTVAVDTFFGPLGALEVTCLGVSGSRATVVVKAPPNTSGVAGLQIAVQDGGPGGDDKLDFQVIYVLPTGCAAPTVVFTPVVHGDLVVVDAPPLPTSKEQCKGGGWRAFGFKSQGACVSFVAASRPAP
jgi:hypothetical protein